MPKQPYGLENLKKLRTIVEMHQHAQLSFAHGGKVRVGALTARVLVKVHDALKTGEAKDKFVRMLETKPLFGRLLNFAWKQVK